MLKDSGSASQQEDLFKTFSDLYEHFDNIKPAGATPRPPPDSAAPETSKYLVICFLLTLFHTPFRKRIMAQVSKTQVSF